MNRLLLVLALLVAPLFGAVNARNGVSINTASTINGVTPNSAINGISLASAIDPDAQTYFDQVALVGGTLTAPTKSAINAFVIGCKADGIWDLLLDVGPMCGDTLTAGIVKLKKLSVSWSYSNSNFNVGDFAQATGLTGNGSNKRLDTGVDADDLTPGSSGLCVYDRTTANGTWNSHGCLNSASETFTVHAPFSDDQPYSDMYASANQVNGSAISGPVGFIHAVRSSGPLNSVYRNGVSVASSGTVGGTLPAVEISFFARRIPGSPFADLYSTHSNSFLAITAGMDATQAAALYARVQALQVALGRDV